MPICEFGICSMPYLFFPILGHLWTYGIFSTSSGTCSMATTFCNFLCLGGGILDRFQNRRDGSREMMILNQCFRSPICIWSYGQCSKWTFALPWVVTRAQKRPNGTYGTYETRSWRKRKNVIRESCWLTSFFQKRLAEGLAEWPRWHETHIILCGPLTGLRRPETDGRKK